MGKFKIGDKVEVIEAYNNYKVGNTGTITSVNESYRFGTFYRINGDKGGAPDDFFKKVNDLYEDQWHLNDGKVEIPDDADKLEKDGSVVAFRKRKAKPLEFGDVLIGKCSETEYRFIKYDNTGISKYKYATLLSSVNSILRGQNLDNYKLKTNDKEKI